MTTEDDRLRLDAYIDGELDPVHALEFERRLAADPALAEERRRIEALRSVMGERLPRAAASPALRRRIEEMAQPPRAAVNRRSGWAALAATAAIAFAGGSLATLAALGPGQFLAGRREPLPELLAASHMRALMAAQAVDVASSDRHTVKPWFAGKVTASPKVVNLSAQGFSLVGGRIDVIGLTPVPALVYRVRLHVISITALPLTDRAAAPPHPVNGYNVIAWTDGPLAYWVVSDLAAPDLESFAKAFRAGDAEP